jgi:hypothetical protein
MECATSETVLFASVALLVTYTTTSPEPRDPARQNTAKTKFSNSDPLYMRFFITLRRGSGQFREGNIPCIAMQKLTHKYG